MATKNNISALIDDMGRHDVTTEELSRAALVSEMSLVNKLSNNGGADISGEELSYFQYLIGKICDKRRREFGSGRKKETKHDA
jgi:hypothetical protein